MATATKSAKKVKLAPHQILSEDKKFIDKMIGAEGKTEVAKKPAKKTTGKAAPKKTIAKTTDKERKPSIRSAIFELFKSKGVDEVTLAEATRAAKKIKASSAFNQLHLNWYKQNYAKSKKK